jgi:hypothetical protein
MSQKLYIYDQTSSLDREQASGRFSASDNVHTVPTDGVKDLQRRLDELVASGETFNRVLFQTHGASDYDGHIAFGNDWVHAERLVRDFGGREYHKLFPSYTRIYFDGCNVARGEKGTRFLLTAGGLFLRSRGGEVFGFTGTGRAMPGFLPFIGGHTIHYSDEFKMFCFRPGGFVIPRPKGEPLKLGSHGFNDLSHR